MLVNSSPQWSRFLKIAGPKPGHQADPSCRQPAPLTPAQGPRTGPRPMPRRPLGHPLQFRPCQPSKNLWRLARPRRAVSDSRLPRWSLDRPGRSSVAAQSRRPGFAEVAAGLSVAGSSCTMAVPLCPVGRLERGTAAVCPGWAQAGTPGAPRSMTSADRHQVGRTSSRTWLRRLSSNQPARTLLVPFSRRLAGCSWPVSHQDR